MDGINEDYSVKDGISETDAEDIRDAAEETGRQIVEILIESGILDRR